MKTAVMTDSNSGIGFAEAEQLGIYVLPMPVIIDNDIYFENINIDEERFYELQKEKNITTSQPAPGAVCEMWDHLLEHYDEVIYIPMSSGLSSAMQTGRMLADDYDGKVVVCDNRRISVTLRDSIYQAIEMSNAGMSAQQIADFLEATSSLNSIYITVDTLEYLKKGGRITAAAAALGTILSVKPVLSIQGDKLEAFAKCRGFRKGQEKMIEALKSDIEKRFSDYKISELRLSVAGSGLSREEKESWTTMVRNAFPDFKVEYAPLSISIGTHTGPKAMGIGISVIKTNI